MGGAYLRRINHDELVMPRGSRWRCVNHSWTLHWVTCKPKVIVTYKRELMFAAPMSTIEEQYKMLHVRH